MTSNASADPAIQSTSQNTAFHNEHAQPNPSEVRQKIFERMKKSKRTSRSSGPFNLDPDTDSDEELHPQRSSRKASRSDQPKIKNQSNLQIDSDDKAKQLPNQCKRGFLVTLNTKH